MKTELKREEVFEAQWEQRYRRKPTIMKSYDCAGLNEKGQPVNKTKIETHVIFKTRHFQMDEVLTEVEGLTDHIVLNEYSIDSNGMKDKLLNTVVYKSDRPNLEAEVYIAEKCGE